MPPDIFEKLQETETEEESQFNIELKSKEVMRATRGNETKGHIEKNITKNTYQAF
jgi:hypothetical protein